MNLGRFLFISVNSKPITFTFKELKEVNPGLSLVWKNYCNYINNNSSIVGEDSYEICWMDKAMNVPEFCKLDMVCLGFMSEGKLKTKELRGEETDILKELNKILDKVQENEWILCGWNIKNYDVPLLNKRFMINRIKPHPILPKSDTKPWEMKQLFDLKEFWNGMASRGINSIDAVYYSICDNKDVSIMEGLNEEENERNKILKMYSVIKELGNME